jgi:hypothetical protein
LPPPAQSSHGALVDRVAEAVRKGQSPSPGGYPATLLLLPQGDSGLPARENRAHLSISSMRHSVAAEMNHGHPSMAARRVIRRSLLLCIGSAPENDCRLQKGHTGSTPLPTRSCCSAAATFGLPRGSSGVTRASNADAASPQQLPCSCCRVGDFAEARRCRPGRCGGSDSRGSERPLSCPPVNCSSGSVISRVLSIVQSCHAVARSVKL